MAMKRSIQDDDPSLLLQFLIPAAKAQSVIAVPEVTEAEAISMLERKTNGPYQGILASIVPANTSIIKAEEVNPQAAAICLYQGILVLLPLTVAILTVVQAEEAGAEVIAVVPETASGPRQWNPALIAPVAIAVTEVVEVAPNVAIILEKKMNGMH